MVTLIEEPLSLGQASRLAADYDTVLLRATRDADLETPIGAFLALDDGTPAYPVSYTHLTLPTICSV